MGKALHSHAPGQTDLIRRLEEAQRAIAGIKRRLDETKAASARLLKAAEAQRHRRMGASR